MILPITVLSVVSLCEHPCHKAALTQECCLTVGGRAWEVGFHLVAFLDRRRVAFERAKGPFYTGPSRRFVLRRASSH